MLHVFKTCLEHFQHVLTLLPKTSMQRNTCLIVFPNALQKGFPHVFQFVKYSEDAWETFFCKVPRNYEPRGMSPLAAAEVRRTPRWLVGFPRGGGEACKTPPRSIGMMVEDEKRGRGLGSGVGTWVG